MKKKKLLFILLGVFTAFYIGASVFFALQGVSAARKRQVYYDIYRAYAEEYIKSDPEMLGKYGKDISVKFDDTVTYRESGERGFFDTYIELFAPQVPDNLEEFTNGMEMLRFEVKINGDLYEITFEKNSAGQLVVSSLIEGKP